MCSSLSSKTTPRCEGVDSDAGEITQQPSGISIPRLEPAEGVPLSGRSRSILESRRRENLILLALVFILTPLLWATGAAEDPWEDCISSDPDRSIRGCTQIIVRGKDETEISRASAHYNRGLAYDKKGDIDRAIDDYSKAIAGNPKLSVAHNDRATLYWRKGEIALALADLDKAIAIDTKNDAAYNNRGNVYYHKRDFDRAIADFGKAISIEPNNSAAYNNRGNAYYKKDDADRAIADYTKAIDLSPEDYEFYDNRGRGYEMKGSKEQAIADYRRALTFNPSLQTSIDSLKRLGVTP